MPENKRTSDSREYMMLAISEASKCISEPGKVSPMVGAVVVRIGKEVVATHRGAQEQGEHAEFTALEKILKGELVAGSTVYTTLEPCTTRNHPKISCTERLIDRKVKRVVIGMLDPNPLICGKGVNKLREHGIEIAMFDPDLAAQVEEQNRDFRRSIAQGVNSEKTIKIFTDRYQNRPLDDWYRSLNFVYANRNFYRDPVSIFAHLVEVVGGLSQLASTKQKPGRTPEAYLPKAIAWWLALCGKMGVTSVSQLLWLKFPGVCPYCLKEECDRTDCGEIKKTSPGPNWKELRKIATKGKPPTSLGAWQRMFRSIYKPAHKVDFEATFARLGEELGELAEAVRVFPAKPGYFLSEAADVFAWLMSIQNSIDQKDRKSAQDHGESLEKQFCRDYPDYCIDCNQQRCVCSPILDKTIGRIAHELPMEVELFSKEGIFMTPDKTRAAFTLPT